MRIVSLVPHATELLFALGLGDDVVARHPRVRLPAEAADAAARHARRAARRASRPAEIDAAVRERTEARRGDLRARRASCCASSSPTSSSPRSCARSAPSRYDDVRAVAAELPDRRPQVIALDPTTLGETMGDVRTVAAGDRRARRRAGPASPASGHASTACGAPCTGAPRRAGRGARVARPGLRRRATGRRSSSSWPAASTCSACPASTPSRPTWEAVAAAASRRSSSPCRAATTPRARWRRRDVRRAGWPRSAPGASSRSTPRRTSRGRGRGSSTALELLAHVLHPDRVAAPEGVAPALDVPLPAAAQRLGRRRRR